MLYIYTPQTVGGRIIDLRTGKYHTENYHEGKYSTVFISGESEIINYIVRFFGTGKEEILKIISNVELEFKKHKNEESYYPVIKEA